MSIISIQGRVHKRGSNDNGEWAVIKEHATKRDGESYEVSYMCGAAKNEAVPAEGSQVVVTGFAYAKVNENDGKHYANINLSAARFHVLSAVSAAPMNDAPISDDEAEDIPF
jgi:hypothetical protein